MSEVPKPTAPPLRWQDAKRSAADLDFDLPQPALGTPVYILAAGVDAETLTLLRAFVRAAERTGHRVKLL